ncbi:uncharacterized protein CTRU02_208554 [Colletotrichum truncatum]|uniref:Uncharacterized protein n=1 Tax=Colletotrichum truncatum TaxID=5467 RepID=A0ACC3YWT5_COLTU
MRHFTVLVALFAALSIAVPTGNMVERQTEESGTEEDVCVEDSGISLCTLGTPLCCRVDREGLTTMDCMPSTEDITKVPSASSITSFQAACLAHGNRRPRCCTLNVVCPCDANLT